MYHLGYCKIRGKITYDRKSWREQSDLRFFRGGLLILVGYKRQQLIVAGRFYKPLEV
jgi:hypothetical protein